jgi:hypothetical protein
MVERRVLYAYFISWPCKSCRSYTFCRSSFRHKF